MLGTTKQFLKKFDEAMRAMATFNGAGVAGVVALMQKSGPVLWTIRGAGIAFMVGIFSSVAMWIFIGIPESIAEGEKTPEGAREAEKTLMRATVALYVSAAAFLVGTLLALIGA